VSASALRDVQDLLERWRYLTPECPACHQVVHTVDCVLVKVLDRIVREPVAPIPGSPICKRLVGTPQGMEFYRNDALYHAIVQVAAATEKTGGDALDVLIAGLQGACRANRSALARVLELESGMARPVFVPLPPDGKLPRPARHTPA
jgi:hypothetical protein